MKLLLLHELLMLPLIGQVFMTLGRFAVQISVSAKDDGFMRNPL